MAAALRLAVILLATVAARAQVLITEIMYDPVKDRGTEYIELFNPSPQPVSLRDWRIVDATGKPQATLPRLASIEANARLVIAADSLIYRQFPYLVDSTNVLVLDRTSLGLNESGDLVSILEPTGSVVDSLTYDPDWHRPDLDSRDGTSLERASKTAPSSNTHTWTSSVARAGGTPGAVNSIEVDPTVEDAEIVVWPPTVSPDADGFEDVTRISYRLPSRTARVNVTLHDRHGRLIDRLVNNEPSGPEGEVIWNAFDPNGMPLASGIYIVRIEAYDAVGIGLSSCRTGVVVARR